MDLVDYRWMPWPSYLMSCTSPKIDASMSAIGDLTIWPHIPATQTSTLVTCTLFNMKFVLASTLPTDKGWCNYLCSPCLVVGWFPFDAPSAQWPFGGASRREPVHCLVHVERAFVASMLRTYLASTLANFNAFSSCSSLHRSSKRRGIDVAFVQVLWAMRFPHFLFFPKVEPIAVAWRCHFGFVWSTIICCYWTSFKKLEAPNNAHIWHPNLLDTSFSYHFSTQSCQIRGVDVAFVWVLWAMFLFLLQSDLLTITLLLYYYFTKTWVPKFWETWRNSIRIT
jgi:hypothetical protein